MAIAAVLVPAVLLITFLANNPTVLVVLLAGGGGLATWRISAARRRRKELAEWQRRQYELEVIRSREIAPYLSMNARQFEEALAFLCGRDGCTGARVVGGTGDLGADVIAATPSGHRLVIQAKRYQEGNLVTGPDLQKFGGTCYAVHRADLAVVITTSSFTKQARDYAAQVGIALLDRQALAAWASGTGSPPWAALGQIPGSTRL